MFKGQREVRLPVPLPLLLLATTTVKALPARAPNCTTSWRASFRRGLSSCSSHRVRCSAPPRAPAWQPPRRARSDARPAMRTSGPLARSSSPPKPQRPLRPPPPPPRTLEAMVRLRRGLRRRRRASRRLFEGGRARGGAVAPLGAPPVRAALRASAAARASPATPTASRAVRPATVAAATRRPLENSEREMGALSVLVGMQRERRAPPAQLTPSERSASHSTAPS